MVTVLKNKCQPNNAKTFLDKINEFSVKSINDKINIIGLILQHLSIWDKLLMEKKTKCFNKVNVTDMR